MLTIKQLMKITTLKSSPPWQVSTLSAKRPLSLRSTVNIIGAKKSCCSIQIRDPQVLRISLGPDDDISDVDPGIFSSNWSESYPSRATLATIAESFDFIYLDKYWLSAVISGTVEDFVNLPTIIIPGVSTPDLELHRLDSAGDKILKGIAWLASGTATVAGGVAAVNPIVIGAGFVLGAVGGIELGGGLVQLYYDLYPPPKVYTIPEVVIYGQLPQGVTPDNIINLPTIEISSLPGKPPAAPPWTGGHPGVPVGGGGTPPGGGAPPGQGPQVPDGPGGPEPPDGPGGEP